MLWLTLWNYSLYGVALPTLNTMGEIQYYLNLTCHALLIPMGGLPVSEQKQRRNRWGDKETRG